jgi:menaquinone reductase, molybdopterin-binding-like subunit
VLLSRRELLELLGISAGGAVLGGCGRPWRLSDELVARAQRGPGLERQVQTVCGLCEGGCGVTVRLVDDLPVGLAGSPRHPLNRGGLCAVGQAGLEVLYSAERLEGPLRRGADGALQPTTWEEALAEIAGRLGELREAGEGRRVAVLSAEPGRLFDDLTQRFARALGSPNAAHLADAAALAYGLSQGLDGTPGFDLAHTDLAISFGLDLFEDGPAPLHAIAAMVGARPTERRAGLIHVGTRLSPSATKAAERVAVRPGTHAAFALGVAHVLVQEGRFDGRFVAERTFGFEDWIDEDGHQRLGFRRLLLEQYYPDRAASLCGCSPRQLVSVARRLARAAAPVALAGGEAVQGTNATWTVLAVHALNALLGAFDRPGGVLLPAPIPLTSLPALAEEPSASGSIFAAEDRGGVFGCDPVAALAEGVSSGRYPLEVLFVVGCDPLHDSPASEALSRALGRIPMVVTFASFLDDTAAAATHVLPGHVPLESWREATTPPGVSFSVLGLGHPVVEPLLDTRHPGDVLLELARRIGAPAAAALPWGSYQEYLRHRLEGLALSGQGSVVAGSFEESWIQFLELRGWRFQQHASEEALWRDLMLEGAWWNPVHSAGDWGRLLPTPSGRYELFSRVLERRLVELGGGDGASDPEAMARGIAALGLAAAGDEACLPHYEPPRSAGTGELDLVPFRPLTARGPFAVASPMVLEMFGYPLAMGWRTWAEIAPQTAAEHDLRDGDRVAVESDRGAVEAVLRLQAGAVPGVVHLPLGLGHRALHGDGGPIGGNPVVLLEPVTDDLSGTLSSTSTRVRLRLLERRRRGGPVPPGAHI